MGYKNYGDQHGDNSVVVGTGDFRGANLSVGDQSRRVFNWNELNTTRNVVFEHRIGTKAGFTTFGVVSGLASILGTAITLLDRFSLPSYLPIIFSFTTVIGAGFFIFGAMLGRKGIEPFFGREYFLELGDSGGIYLTKFKAECPMCMENGKKSRMRLRNVALKNQERDDRFVCERNPRQHTITFDPTILDEISE